MTENLSKILPYILSATAAGLVGGLIASFWNPRVKMRSAIQHFAAGAVLAAVASNVVPKVEKIGNLTGIVIGFGGQDTLLKALIVGVLPQGKRNLAFGLFYTGYGTGWLLGSITTGLLYDHSRLILVVFSVIAQLVSLPLFIIAQKANR